MTQLINQSSGISQSYWLPSKRSLHYPALTSPLSVDVAIVGAGIAGLSIAYELNKRGLSVTVFEDGLIGSGESGRTSAHLSNYIDYGYSDSIKNFGLKKAQLVAQSHAEAISTIEKIAFTEAIDCDFKRVDAYLFRENGRGFPLEKEAEALTQMAFPFSWVERAPFKNFNSGRCIKFSHQAQFHPFKYIKGLADSLTKKGVQIFEGTHIAKIHDGSGSGRPPELFTSDGLKITAQDVVVASHSPFVDRLILQTKIAQYRSYVIGVLVPKGELSEALYWDTLDPYHYVRKVDSSHADKDCFLVGGKDHKTGQCADPKSLFCELKEWVSNKFSDYEVVYEWSGQIVEPVDGLAFIGRNPSSNHIFIHTGMSGNGLTYGVIASSLIADLISKKKSPYKKLYAPRRKTLKAAVEYLKEVSNMGAQYSDWFQRGEEDIGEIPSEDGVIVRRGLQLEAVFKNAEGKLHRMSAVCPHLGGIVRWNSLEKSWDCPCHGSRFSATGELLNGPANRGLTKIKPRTARPKNNKSEP